jgi:hypothetical protein
VKFESFDDPKIKERYRVVRTLNYTDVPGDIVMADELTGDCTMQDAENTRAYHFGPLGIRIIRK